MNKRRSNISSNDEELFRGIFTDAQPRPRAPEEDRQAIFSAVHRVWTAAGQRRLNRRRLLTGLAMAASIFLALAVVFVARVPTLPKTSVATVVDLSGNLSVSSDGKLWRPLLRSDDVKINDSIRVTGGVVLLAVPNGGSLRIAQNSALTFLNTNTVRLKQGRLYFDSQSSDSTDGLEVHTQAGVIRDIGTQFAVTAGKETVTVSVRSGLVVWQTKDSQKASFDAGETGQIKHDGNLIRSRVPTHGPQWAWAESMTPTLKLKGKPAMALLLWFERETGRTIEFESREAERLARNERLLGGTMKAATLKKLNSMLETVELISRIEGGIIYIRVLE